MIKNKIIKLKLSHLVIGGIIFLVLMFLLYIKTESAPLPNYDKQKREIDSLGTIINQLQSDQLILNENLSKQFTKVDSLNKEIKTTEKELTQTRAYYGNKIKDLNSSSPSELNEFFTERYH
jgi:peptidoglycan hydrolase CwlO-like protein